MEPRPKDPDQHELTRFLNDLARGKAAAAETLMPFVYAELRGIAESHLRGQAPRHTLQPTALVHEAFLKLFDPDRVGWNDRKHFFALAAKAMRQVLVDHARRARRLKRGDGRLCVALDEHVAGPAGTATDLVDLNLALDELGALDERQGRIVELRYFGGLEVQEVAEVLAVSTSTVEREWRTARAWLGVRLEALGA
ncbi:MAG: sigma-70 family RNA polymerase sigma factor [Planctomycetes bacterium]|nr:sigma-70 family RNA polymerase sigma factor [Planctomycetota bacterium]